MRIGVFCSGGDSPGMNPAIRAVTRCALDRGIEVIGIHEGWQGVVDGGAKFETFNWRSVGGILQMGGTILGTARSDAFRTAPGRRQAACNLVNAGIDGLVVIGGDGSLTGALILVQEWESHLVALAAEGLIPAEKAENPAPLRDRRAAGVDRQRPVRHRHEHRRGYGAAHHRRGGRQAQIHGRLAPAHLRRRGDGPALRLPGADGRGGDRRRLGVDPGRGDGRPLALPHGRGAQTRPGGGPASRRHPLRRRRPPQRWPADQG